MVSGTPQRKNFEKAKEATLTLLALKDTLTLSELETLEILLDKSTKFTWIKDTNC